MFSPLALAADQAIDTATRDSTYVNGTNEPSLVARLVAALPDLLVQRWRPHFASGMLHASSGFCHHRPQVHWDAVGLGSGRPELCDLLLMVASPDSTGTMAESALLIQAKDGVCGYGSLSKLGDMKQRYMYANWPEFHFAGNCSGQAANCMPMSSRYRLRTHAGIGLGARYGIVSELGSPTWLLEQHAATWAPQPKSGTAILGSFNDVSTINVAGTISLGQALEQMVNKSLGCSVDNSLNDDWSNVVAELLAHAIASASKTKFHMVGHTPGAPLVPLASASTFVTTDWLTGRPSRLIAGRLWRWEWELLGRPGSWFHGDDGRYRRKPPDELEYGKVNGGFGVIRIVVGGRFKDMPEQGRTPDRPRG